MDVQDILLLYQYNYWARDRILEQVVKLSPQQLLESRTYGHGSIRNVLVHILSAEWVWRVRCQEQVSPSALLPLDDYPGFEPLRVRYLQEEERMQGYLNSLHGTELYQEVRYQTTGGEEQANVLWHLLVHIVNHGTEHRSQVASELTAYGYSPGDLDLVHFVRAGST